MYSEQSAALIEPIQTLLAYCKDNQWAGYDPYDALNSRLFGATPFARVPLCRLGLTQIVKRLPVNIRPLLVVPKEQNPKGIALFASALIQLAPDGLSTEDEARVLVERLLELRSPGIRHFCWGYNFDWQTRTHLVPKGTPNIICTTFAGNALLDAYETFALPRYLEAATSAGHFLLGGLNRTGDAAETCFSYTPLDRSQIHNANLLGAAFLARLHDKTGHAEFARASLPCARFSVNRQAADGSWFYGESPKQRWIDSFHTGYNLCALERLRVSFPEESWIKSSIEKGFRFLMDNFFTADGVAKYYHDKIYPVDIHSVAQALVTLTYLSHYSPQAIPTAWRVLDWGLKHMRAKNGAFIFQMHPYYSNRISYMRWGQAWMLLGMTCLWSAIRRQAEPATFQKTNTMEKTPIAKRDEPGSILQRAAFSADQTETARAQNEVKE